MIRRVFGAAVAGVILLVLSGCSMGIMADDPWLDNRRALASTLWAPVQGPPPLCGYVNPAYEDRELGVVRVTPVSPLGTRREVNLNSFLARVGGKTAQAVQIVLAESGKFQAVTPLAADPAQFELSTEMVIHLAVANGSLVPDPITGERLTKAFVIYTLTDTATDAVVLKYTASATSDWGHEESAMEEIEARAVSTAAELAPFLDSL